MSKRIYLNWYNIRTITYMSGLVSAAIVGSITYIISILIVATAKAAPVNKKVDDKGREQGKRKGKKIQRRGKYY
ncbi:MAG TPA: hypothetical protein VLA48_03980 [Nitrososphaeraceae archaeon]|nr:hypothetical protein [Nitrososphaeraceae archaeon]